jgi:hypothetical protein
MQPPTSFPRLVARAAITIRHSPADPPAPRRCSFASGHAWLNLTSVWIVSAVAVALRAWSAATWQLLPDEAYYWVWSRHPAWSYLDHPPMTAWLIRASTWALGTSELTIRLPALLMALLLPPLFAATLGSRRPEACLASLLLACGPITSVTGTLMTPDAPVLFFGSLAIAIAARVCERAERPQSGASGAALWLSFGVFIGLALLSKYTAVLIAPAMAGALLSSRRTRLALLRPAPWGAVAAAAVLFLPVIAWNAAHHWASFRFQLRHGLGDAGGSPTARLIDYAGGQLLAWTPVLAVVSVWAVASMIRRYRSLHSSDRFILWAAAVPLLFFAWSATRHRPEVNWPLLAYPAVALLTARFAFFASQPRAAALLKAGVVIAALGAAAVQFPVLILQTGLWTNHAGQMFGYRGLAAEVHRLRDGRPVFANRYQEAAELSFYLPGRPEVRSFNLWGSRANAYDYFDAATTTPTLDGAVLVGCRAALLTGSVEILRDVEHHTRALDRFVRTDSIIVTGVRLDTTEGPPDEVP